MEINKLLGKAGLTQNLDQDELEALLDVCEVYGYSRGENIISEVTRNRDMFIISSGSVSISFSIPLDEERQEIVDTLHEGELFGELSFVDGCPRSASVSAEGECEVVFIPYEPLDALMTENPKLGYHIMRNISAVIASKLRKTNLAWRNSLVW